MKYSSKIEGVRHTSGVLVIYITDRVMPVHIMGYTNNSRRRMFLMQVIQEYERAVIFRLGRIAPGGAKGPGMTR